MDRSPEEFFARHGTTEHFAPGADDDHWYEQAEKAEQVQSSAYGAHNPERRSVAKPATSDVPSEPTIPKLVYPTTLHGKPIPPMEWAVDQWIPMREVTLLYGDGGVGKTLLAQQLQACSALGKPWCTLPVHQLKSIGVYCEDDDDELHRRQDNIQRHLMTNFDDSRLDAMAWWCRKGQDNLLATFDYENKLHPTPFYEAIITAAQEHGARLIILDTAADLFAGNENDRGQVRQFIGLLAKMAITCDAAVVLCAHPSRSGMSTGTMDSGSTGWSNSARSRLSLERPKADGDAEVDTDERLLSKKKSNRSSIGDTIKLRWKDGVIASTRGTALTSSTVLADAIGAERSFLTLLERLGQQGIYVSHSSKAGNFAPKVFSKRPDREGFSLKEFDAAMNRLFAANAIRVGEYKTASRHTRDRIEVVTKPDEIEETT